MTDPNAKVEKFLPEEFLRVLGDNLPAIYEAANENIAGLEDLVQSAIDQLFLTSASGRYLVRLGEERGFVMPANSGLDIRSYRVLVPLMVSAPKQVRLTIDELVNAFYNNRTTKPFVLSSTPGPYSLEDGDDLIIETDRGTTTISIVDDLVADLNSVSAQEIVSVMNASQDEFLAETQRDRTTGLSSVKISSKTFGSGAFVRIAGGKLQNILLFPTLVETVLDPTTNWNITKDTSYTDLVKIQWDGAGTNPEIYQSNLGDIVTIRGLTDGSEQFSLLNGSYELVDVGYDYFVIRNILFDALSSSVVAGPDNFVFTRQNRITVFDKEEYAITSEVSPQTITLTVPAVPPLARRFLEGAAHPQGNVHEVLDFTRNTIKVAIEQGQNIPAAQNHFLFRSKYQRIDFTKKYYQTEFVNTNVTEPTYNLAVTDDSSSVLPYTVSTSLDVNNPVLAEIGSSEYRVSFDFRHGLQNHWAFNLINLTGAANISAPDLNKEHVVKKVSNEQEVIIRLRDSSGNDLVFDGIVFTTSDVYRHAMTQADGSDFYLEFANTATAVATGLEPGLTFELDALAGTNVNPFLANYLRFIKLSVVSIDGPRVNFSAGLGPGPEGLIIQNIPGKRSGFIGGNSGEYYFDKTSTYNKQYVLSELETVFIGYTQPTNPLFLGPYLYDPNGEQTSLTVSRLIVHSQEKIFKGESRNALMVDPSKLSEDDEFPQTGQIVLDYGSSNVEGPIDYFAYVDSTGSTQIILDPAYVFEKTHEVGSQVQFVHATQPYEPTFDGTDFPFYLTGTTAARNTLFQLAELLVAAGIFVESDVILPELRYADPAIEPFS